MQCVNCKSLVDDDALFCPHCATNLTAPQAGVRNARFKHPGVTIIVAGAALLFLCAAVAAVGLIVFYSDSTSSGPNHRGLPFRSTISEAKEELQQEFQKRYIKCGDSYFKYETVLAGIVELRDVTFSIQEIELNNADRLNGVEWKGVATVDCKLTRHYDALSRQWSDWSSQNLFVNPNGNIGVYSLEKHQGQWRSNISLPRVGDRKIDCGQIPK